MESDAKIDPLLATKFHRPAVDENHVLRPSLLERLDRHRSRPLTLVSAPAGYGKSVLISSWLEQCGVPSSWLSLDKSDNDLHVFVAYFIAAVETLFPAACRNTRSLLNTPNLPPVNTLAAVLLNELDRIEQSFIIALDDYHRIKETAVHDLLTAFLEHPSMTMHLVIIGRVDPPMPIARIRAKGHVNELRSQDLRFTIAETKILLEQLLGIEIDPSTVEAIEAKTEGWITGLRLAVLSMRHRGNLDPALLEPQVDAQYVMEYLFTEVFSRQPPEISEYLLATAILDRFNGPLCEAVCMPDVESTTCQGKGWEFIAWLKTEGLFLIPLDAENRWFRFHNLFQKLLLNQLKRHYSIEVINTLHAKACTWFADNGLLEEALQHAQAAGDLETAASLIAEFSHRMMNDQQWARLERCLYQLPRSQIEQDPALILLEAWIKHIRHDYHGIAACVKRIVALQATSSPDTFVTLRHVPGHLEVFKGILHYMTADGERSLAFCRQALKDIPLHHKRARALANIFQLGAYQMVGHFETGLPIYQKAMAQCIPREKDYHAMHLGHLGSVYWIDADLTAMRQTAEILLDVLKEHPKSPSVYLGFYLKGVAKYHQNELQNAEEELTRLTSGLSAANPVKFEAGILSHGVFALALTYQALGRPDQAREITKSVVHGSIESNNTDILKIARAFEAELALRQGHLATASRWLEKYQAKPLRPSFRFYMPELTPVKILLTENTAASRRQAADLLEKLLDFLESIHNNRFRIDVLALQALLHFARGKEPAAMEKLTQALVLAEPGGFIRVFVDLGPRMADLLKELIQNNIAVKYAGKILAAFREDGLEMISPSPSPPLSSSPAVSASQPLPEPLSKRELEILNLLVQRLPTKEIASKLFIAPSTVKKHLGNIYRKLNVNSRHQAAEKVRMLGILPQQ